MIHHGMVERLFLCLSSKFKSQIQKNITDQMKLHYHLCVENLKREQTFRPDCVQGVQKVLSPTAPSASLASDGLAIWGIDAPHSCHSSLWISVRVISLRGISTTFTVRRLSVQAYHMSVEIHFSLVKGPHGYRNFLRSGWSLWAGCALSQDS
jgi:hypothetical protein